MSWLIRIVQCGQNTDVLLIELKYLPIIANVLSIMLYNAQMLGAQ